jgi:hypothetical protein
MSEPSRAVPSAWVVRLFSRFQAIYGNRTSTMWAEADPDEVRQAWGEELARYTGEDVRDALEVMRLHHQEYPPTLFQFASMCRDAAKRRAQTATKLEPPPMSKASAERAMAQIHATEAKLSQLNADCRDWARKILAREAAGERLPLVALDGAREALRL